MPKYKEEEHPRDSTGKYKNKNANLQPSDLPSNTAEDEETRQRELARKEFPTLSDLYKEEYNRLYSINDQDYNYEKAIEAFDEYAKNNPYEIGEFVNQHGDFISSDREAAAFMFAKWRMNGEYGPKPSTVVSDPFISLSDRSSKCLAYQKAFDRGKFDEAKNMDPDGAMEMMTFAGYSYGNPNQNFHGLDTTSGEAEIQWAVNSFKQRHPDYLVDETAVKNRVQAVLHHDNDAVNAIDEEYPDAGYIMHAAAGHLQPDDARTLYAADYEDMLLTHELSQPTAEYLKATRRLSYRSQHTDLKPGDPCWRTHEGYVSDKAFNQAFDNSQLLADRHIVYATGTDEDRQALETEKWNDQVWLANRASECERANRSSILYRTTFPNMKSEGEES